MKKKIGAALVAAALVVFAAVVITQGITKEDPLISKEYLEGTYEATLLGDIQKHIDTAFSALLTKADGALSNTVKPSSTPQTGWQGADTFQPKSQRVGDVISLSTGSGLLFTAGAATIASTGGEVIDVTEGSAASTLYAIPGHRYLVGESATATVTIESEAATLSLVGGYQVTLSSKAALPFTDISRSAWFYEPVKYVYEKKLFGGVAADQFAPQAPVTRGMLATVLHRLAGSPGPGSEGASFHDVAAGTWYEAGVRWSAGAGVVNGMGEGAFLPEWNVTREQLAVMLYRYATDYEKRTAEPSGDLNAFRDSAAVSTWAQEGLSWAVGAGILKGDTEGSLNPGGFASRAETATMMQRFAAFLGR